MTADLTLLWQTAACGLLRTAEDGTIQIVNETFCRWSGYAADELVERRRVQDLFTVGARIFHQTHWAPLLRMQGSVSEVKVDVTHRDGSVFPIVVNAIRRSEGGTVVHDLAAYVARDRDRYERELMHSRRRLEELHAAAKDRALFAEQMIGIVSHDLRNPLGTVQMCAALLGELTEDAQQQGVIGRLNRATTTATQLIADLLDFTQARLGSGIAVSPTPIALHDAVAGAVDELRFLRPASTIVHVREGVGSCSADPARLAQLLGNLVSNAVAYGDSRVPITVTSVIGPQCAISVHNAGAPIPKELQPQLFEPMTRGDHGHKGRSVGLGLFIVREIMRAHGGEATVTSTAETGTTIAVRWPGTFGR